MVVGMPQQQPLVHCPGCDRDWFGATTAHGLRILGRCPRCDAELEFHCDDAPPPEPEAADERLAGVAPSAVLGRPALPGH
jgi:hypothetical protein